MTAEWKHWATLVFLSVIWGTSFILIKRALVAFSPEHVALLRVSISGMAFLPFFLMRIKRLEWHRWWFYLIIALTGSGIPAVMYATAQTRLSSATSGILNSITPIFALLVGVIFFKNITSSKQVVGVAIGFLGAAALIWLDQPINQQDGIPLFYAGLVILATVFYGTNVNLIKEFFQHVKPIDLSSFAFVLLGFPIFMSIPFTDIPDIISNHPEGMTSLAAVSALALMSTTLALVIFYKLVQDTSAVFASSVAYMIPIVAMIWGFVDGEYVGWMHLLSMVFILIGVYLIRAGQSMPTEAS